MKKNKRIMPEKKRYSVVLKQLFIALSFLSFIKGYAQCPTSINDAAVTTPSTCQSNGSITISGTVSAAIKYQIISGPTGFPIAAQSGNMFSNLLPGTYKVRAFCNTVSDTISNIVIASQYVQLKANSTTSNVCTSSTPGGVINTTASAGSPPYQYAYFTGSPSVPDNTLTYGLSNSFNATAFGTYNVRVKDACGVFVTQQITIARTYPATLCITSASTTYGNLTCAQLADSIYLAFSLSNNATLKSLPAGGIDIQLYTNTGTCASPVQGALIKTQHFGQASTPQIIIPKHNVLLKVVTPCGDVCTYCYSYSVPVLSLTAAIQQSGCSNASNPNGTLAISANVNANFVYPLTYTIKNSGGTTVATKTINSGTVSNVFKNNFPYDTYTVTATDACGNTASQTLTPPVTTGSAAKLTATVSTTINSCTSMNGRVSLDVVLNGILPNMANSTLTIIAPSPTSVGNTGSVTNGNDWAWLNVLPSSTYYIQVNNNCGILDTLTINTPKGTGQNQQILTTVTPLCGGIGNIDVTVSRLGNNTLSFQLLNSSNTVVGTGITSGSFANLPADTYSVVVTVAAGCTYTFSKTGIVIPAAGASPFLQKQLGIVCETATGSPLNTGQALLSIGGVAPLSVDYKLTSQPDNAYVNIDNNSPGFETITGLQPYQSYSVRITDGCGNSIITQISIGRLNAITEEFTSEPCIGQPYTLGVPDMINATYQWTKNGVAISTQREISFPSYTSDADGFYQCLITIGGCITRKVNVILNSANCGQSLLTNLTGNVFDDGNGLSDNTVNGTGISQPSGMQLYINLLDSNGNVVATTPVNSDGSYTLSNLNVGNDVLQLSTNQGTVGTLAPATQLPPTWLNTGENIGAAPGSDGAVNGLLPVSIMGSNINNANFGINYPPTANDTTTAPQMNPGGTAQVTVPALTGKDPEDGTYNGTSGTNIIIIDTLPTNGTLYYNGTAVNAGQTISNYNPALLTVDPVDSAVTLTFAYSEVDSAGVPSAPATVIMPFRITALAVQLLSFNATAVGNNSKLDWQTPANSNARNFIIEHSDDGAITFLSIGQVAAQQSNNISLSYTWYHDNPSIGVHYYRLRMIDDHGNANYSDVKSVTFIDEFGKNVKIYPVPTSTIVQLKLPKAATSDMVIKVYDNAGLLIRTISPNLRQVIPINVQSFATGVYTVTIIRNNTIIYTGRIIKL